MSDCAAVPIQVQARPDPRGSKMQKKVMADDGTGSELFPRSESWLVLDHLHVTENWNEPWLLAEPLVDLDIGSFLEPAVQDVVARGHVGQTKVGGTVTEPDC